MQHNPKHTEIYKYETTRSNKTLLDDEWLEITCLSESKQKYKRLIGRAPKGLVKGEVLDYEVLNIGNIPKQKDYLMRVFLVKDGPNS